VWSPSTTRNANKTRDAIEGTTVAQRRAEMTTLGETSPQIATALRHGVIAAQARDFERARPLLQHVTERTPDDVIAWYWLAIASPSADTAIPCLRRVLEIDEAHALAREALSRLLIAEARSAASAGRRDDARALASEATTLSPDSAVTWRALAELATCQVERIDALRHLVRLQPEDAGLRMQFRQSLLARAVMIARSNRTEARARFQEIAALTPSDTRIWQALCNLADSRGEQAKYLRELLRVAPDHQHARTALRRLLVESARELRTANELEQSRQRWREALEVAGSDVELWLGYADACDDPVEAKRAVHAAQELDSHDPRVLEALAALNGESIDPAALPNPDDAFARFDVAETSSGAVDAEVVDDSALDSLAQLGQIAVRALANVTPVEAAPVEVAPAEATVATNDEPVAEAVDAAEAIVEPQEAAAPDRSIPAEPIAAPAANDAPATVMVVDDSPTIRKILGLTLERAGFNVVLAGNGNTALQSLRDVVPQVILLDISMPDLDGYEVCKRIKQDPRTSAVPVIMLSGKGAFFDKVKGHMAGATEYLTKPFETPAVLAVVTSHCQGHALAEAHHG
jgi:twitching motility two-component system response regulator PilG